MDQLKSNCVSIILTIEEGRGMDFIKNSIILLANFNGRPLESDPIMPMDCPLFNTNLIWEIEKKTLRKIRSSNQPLRIDCLTIDETKNREKIGYLLLDLRSAYIGDIDVPFKWCKLVGLRTKKKNCHPELYLALSITDSLNLTSSNETCLIDKVSNEFLDNTTLKYLEDYIKIGDSIEGNKFFTLNIFIKFASSLDILLPEILVFHENKNKYCMSFKIFEIPIKTKQFYRDLHDKVIFDEKIVIKILSTTETIENFFKNQEIEVSFFSGNDKLGITTVELNALSSSNNNFLNFDYYFKFPSPNGIVPMSSDGRRPFVQLDISLNQIDTNDMAEATVDDEPTFLSENDNKIEKLKKVELIPNNEESPKKIINYHLVINFKDLLMDNKGLKYKIFHPKANNYLEIIDDEFNLQINIIYITTNEEKLKNLLEYWPIKLIVINENNNLISKEHLIKPTLNDLAYHVNLLTENSEILTILNISTSLEKNRLEIHDKNTLLPAILDDNLLIFEIKKIQEWKETQKIEFEHNLEQLKQLMETEWENQKKQLENDFKTNILKCQLLQDELQEKIHNFESNNELITNLKKENEELRKELDQIKQEIELDGKAAETKEQTKKLLQELNVLENNFEMTQKYKNYFKELWKLAYGENDQLKYDDYEEINNEIQQNSQKSVIIFDNNKVGDC